MTQFIKSVYKKRLAIFVETNQKDGLFVNIQIKNILDNKHFGSVLTDNGHCLKLF